MNYKSKLSNYNDSHKDTQKKLWNGADMTILMDTEARIETALERSENARKLLGIFRGTLPKPDGTLGSNENEKAISKKNEEEWLDLEVNVVGEIKVRIEVLSFAAQIKNNRVTPNSYASDLWKSIKKAVIQHNTSDSEQLLKRLQEFKQVYNNNYSCLSDYLYKFELLVDHYENITTIALDDKRKKTYFTRGLSTQRFSQIKDYGDWDDDNITFQQFLEKVQDFNTRRSKIDGLPDRNHKKSYGDPDFITINEKNYENKVNQNLNQHKCRKCHKVGHRKNECKSKEKCKIGRKNCSECLTTLVYSKSRQLK